MTDQKYHTSKIFELKSPDDITDESELFKSMKSNSVDILRVTEESTSDDVIDFANRCGLLGWRPQFMQIFRSIYLFLATLCMVCIVQTALSAGYMSSQITTLERRFSLDSSMLGIIQSFFDVGFICAVIFVGYFGGQGRIPLWIGFGMLIMSFGAYSFALPEFITQYSYNESTADNPSDICTSLNSTLNIRDCETKNTANWLVKFFFIMGQVLIGCGSSPILSLAPTYIDDHVPPTLAPPLISMLYASSALGPVIGFVLGAVMLQYPVNVGLFVHGKAGDQDWIGAWWIGYLLLGSIAAFIAFLLFLFPRRVRKIKKTKMRHLFICRKKHPSIKVEENIIPTVAIQSNEELLNDAPNGYLNTPKDQSQITSEPSVQMSMETIAEQYGKHVKDMPGAIWGLISNKIYVVVSLAICFEMFLVNGFAAFLPKYIESEYKVSNITASLIAGGLIVPAGALGIIAGGMIMHRFQMSRRKAVLFSIIGVFLVLVCMILFFLFGCNNPLFAGINVPIYYKGNKYSKIRNLCNIETCTNKCDPNLFSPICDSDKGITFFSGCYAGCPDFFLDSNSKKSFYNCSCTSYTFEMNGTTTLLPGECSLKCNSLTSFVLFLTLALFLTGITQNPLLMVTMRSVQKHERSFALGFQFVILRLFAYIPSPIVYGTVIDAACVHWKWNCDVRGDCLVTDLKLLNYFLIGLSFAVKCGAAVFYILLYFIVPKHIHNDVNASNSDVIAVEQDTNGDVSKPWLNNKASQGNISLS